MRERMMMRTQDEIVARIRERIDGDVLGFEYPEYAMCLDVEHFREFARKDADLSDWQAASAEPDDVKARMLTYMPFAWDKANNRRGLSANRSVMHIEAWLWLMGEDALLAKVQNEIEYQCYGKPTLAAVCDFFGWDWRAWDDGMWTNSSDSDGVPADVALGCARRGTP